MELGAWWDFDGGEPWGRREWDSWGALSGALASEAEARSGPCTAPESI